MLIGVTTRPFDRARQHSLSISQSEPMNPQEGQRHLVIRMFSISKPTLHTQCPHMLQHKLNHMQFQENTDTVCVGLPEFLLPH